MKLRLFMLFAIAFSIFACTGQNSDKVQDANISTGAETLSAGKIKAVFIDNSAFGENHRAGYNGIAALYHDAQDSSIFVPFYAGFNIEHIFGGDSLIELFEPRRHTIELERIDENSVVLHQPKTPLSRVESWTTFTLTPPHYIDVNFRCIFHSEDFFQHGYAGIFWASYINAPADKKIYFYGREKSDSQMKWLSGWSPEHGVKGTHVSVDDDINFYMAPNFKVTLASDFSDQLYEQPFYYGRFHNMVFAYMFDIPKEGVIRFSQSPTGGGELNPAWDFQFLVPDFKTKTPYEFSARLVYKEFIDAEDMAAEFSHWSSRQNQ